MASLVTAFTRLALGLPAHCTPTTPFLVDVSTYFHICVPTPLAAVSSLLGTLSIISWLFAQLPQIYKNYQLQSTSGLSIYFLIEWCLGDSTNLIGAILTHQAGWQVVIAAYYVFVDVCLVTQYFWYTYTKIWMYGDSLSSESSSERGDNDRDIIYSLSPNGSSSRQRLPSKTRATDSQVDPPKSKARPINAPKFNHVSYEKRGGASPSNPTIIRVNDASSSWTAAPSPRTVLYIATFCALVSSVAATPVSTGTATSQNRHILKHNTYLETLGTILSWISTCLYLGSRLPQLYKNWDRQSTAGLSPLLFAAAFSGNLFYSSSLLTNPNAWHNYKAYGGHGWAGRTGSKQAEWLAAATPFFLGAAGVLGLDAAMGIQFLMYGEKKEEKIIKVKDAEGRTRWQRVSGWMRGWVPSMGGKEKVVAIEEGERLLSQSRELERRDYDYGGMS